MTKSVCAVLIFLASLQLSCSDDRTVRADLHAAESALETDPDRALTLLKNSDTKSLGSRKLKARYALLYSRALDKNYIDLQSDSIIAPAVAYYSNRGSARDRAYTNYYLGCVRYNAGDLDEAVRLMVGAETPAAETADSYLLARIYACLGRMYQDQHSFETADSMFSKAQTQFRIEGDSLNMGYVIVNRALVHSLMDRSADAIAGYRRARMLFERLGDRAKASEMTRNIVNELSEADTVPADSLKRILRRAYADTPSRDIPAADYSMWASLFCRENELDSARYYAVRALAQDEKFPNRKCGMIMQMCRLEEWAGNYREAIGYWHRYYDLFNSIVTDDKRQLVQEAEKRYRNQELDYQNKLLRLKNTYINIAWCVAALSCLAALGFVFRRIIHRYRQFIGVLSDNYNTFMERYLQLSEEIGAGTAEEADLLEAIETKLKGFQSLLEKAYNPRKPQTFIDEFRDYAASISRDASAFADLQYVVNKRFYGLVDYLRNRHPKLTSYELDMLCMLQFGFSFNCIRLLHSHENIYSLYTRRTKIHKKLGLPPHFRLEDYLAETVEKLKAAK